MSNINPNLLANLPLGSLDPKNPLFMPFGGLGALGNLNNLGLANPLFGFGLPGMGGLGDLHGLVSSGADGKGSGMPNLKDTLAYSSFSGTQPTFSTSTSVSSGSKKEDKKKSSSGNSSSAAAAAAAAAASQNMLSSALPFLFPNPGLMYNPLGLGSFPMGPGMNSSFANLAGAQNLVNGVGSSGSKKSSSGSKSSSAQAQSMAAAQAALAASLNIPNFGNVSRKESQQGNSGNKDVRSSAKVRDQISSGGGMNLTSSAISAAQLLAQQHADDSDDESNKSLLGNHADDLPDEDEPTNENAERVVLKGIIMFGWINGGGLWQCALRCSKNFKNCVGYCCRK